MSGLKMTENGVVVLGEGRPWGIFVDRVGLGISSYE